MQQVTEISIREISLSGFRNQKELVSFALGDVNCVTGHNGTGKTTLAHAVAFAFYGVTYFGEQKADRLINSESAGCEVKVDFSDQNGVLHSLIRRRFGSKTELIFDSFSVRQEEINRFICDKDTFLCIFNPFYLTSFGEARGRELIFRNLKTVGSDSILAAISDGFKKPLEGISITEPGVMLSFYRAGIRRCDEQIKIAEAKRATLRETVQANDAECDRLNEQAEVSAATVHILKEKQFSGLDLNSFRQRRSELNNGASCTLGNDGNLFKNRADFVGTVNVDTLTNITLNRIEYHQFGISLPNCLFNSFIRQRKRIGVLADIKHPAFICTGFDESWLDGVAEPILCGLINHIEGFCDFHTGQSLARRTSGGESQSKSCFTFTGVTLDDSQLSEWDIRFPKPFDFLKLHVRHSNKG